MKAVTAVYYQRGRHVAYKSRKKKFKAAETEASFLDPGQSKFFMPSLFH
ncbi:MAG: hypothetical protein A4E66_01957 [Syntrophus sp. PtaB.Bin001]|nr:MAG: hypothetical protein A4E66_01957 [Syntrophus sp. PtaB.Bin001]